MLSVEKKVTGALATNTYLVSDSGQYIVVDPGADGRVLMEECEGDIVAVVCTHGHGDHIAGIQPFRDAGIPVWIGREDDPMLTDAEKNVSAFAGMPVEFARGADRLLEAGDKVTVGQVNFDVLYLPGHSQGSIGLHTSKILFCGDVLFQASVGRTDLPGGSFTILEETVREKIYSLDGDTIVYPGHGPLTTVDAEKSSNPFVRPH